MGQAPPGQSLGSVYSSAPTGPDPQTRTVGAERMTRKASLQKHSKQATSNQYLQWTVTEHVFKNLQTLFSTTAS